MSFPVRSLVSALAAMTWLSACEVPQDVAGTNQVLEGAEAPDATFAVRLVTRDSLPQLMDWPNSHPTPNLGWITHASTPSDPLIAAGDKLDVTVWNNDESSLLSQPEQKIISLPGLLVSTKGTIFLPYADEVYVANMTPDEARVAIQTKLLGLIPSAQVLLALTSGSNNSVELVSGVANPGIYPLIDRSTSLTSVLALGGGIPSEMSNPQVNLSRGGKLYRVSADTLLSQPNLDTTLRGGDKIYVRPESRYFLSLGAAGKETLVTFPRDRVTALDAMSLIGGVQAQTANPKGIMILRDYPQSAVRQDGKGPPRDRMIFAMDLTTADGLFSAGEFTIQDRDLVLVTQSPLINTRTVLGAVGVALGLVKTANQISNQLNN